jgi:HAD superfamily hydrolase (TIGR01509 family)
LFPEVVPSLEALKVAGYKLALASSSDHAAIDHILSENALAAYFPVVLSGQDFKESKPNPEIYLTAMKRLGAAPEETLIIEDSAVGIRSGKAAGATVWAIEYKDVEIDQSEADLLIDDLSVIAEKL